MRRRDIAIFFGAATIASSTPMGGVATAFAQPCPDVEVVFARGTTEEPGAGPTGDAFVKALRSRIGTKTLDLYPVDYPATTDFPKALDGVRDASARVESMAANCPNTNIVLGGFSQGAAVAGYVTADMIPDGAPEGAPNPMPDDVAKRVVAVTLFGKPNDRFMRAINQPDVDVGPLYADKTVELCVDDDFVCSSGRDFNAHTQYVETGMVDRAAIFAAGKVLTAIPPEGNGQAPAAAPPQPHLQSSPETITSCTTECRVVGPE